jgi:hypothetical protein
MPLEICPWMAARCPHYRLECKDDESSHCYIVKSTTSAARTTLRQLRESHDQHGSHDPDLQKQIQDLERFLSGAGKI